jgi:ArsR family transcriptional regulator
MSIPVSTAVRIDPAKMERAAFILKTLAHPTRLGIVELLGSTPRLNVSEICEELNLEQTLASHHLTDMKLKGLLSCQREGKHIYYSLVMREVLGVLSCIEKCNTI